MAPQRPKKPPLPRGKTRGATAHAAVRNINAREKERKALALKKAGATYEEIAKQVGYSDAGGAHKAVKRALEMIPREEAVEYRTLQQQRLDHMLLVLWPKVTDASHPDHFAAIDRAQRLIDQMNRMNGVDAPVKVEGTVHHEGAILVIDGDKEEYLRNLQRMAGAIDVPSREVVQHEDVPGGDGEDDEPPSLDTGSELGVPVNAATDADLVSTIAEMREQEEKTTVRPTFDFLVEPDEEEDK